MTPEQQRVQQEALIQRLMKVARERVAKDVKLRQWALEYVARNGAANADDAVREAQTLLDFLATELPQETDS